jgi:hypothetical protein
MDDTLITIAMLGTGPGAYIVTNGALLALNAGLGRYFNELANRLTSMILPIILVEVAIASSGSRDWELFVVGFFTGLLASVGTKISQTTYDKQVLQVATPAQIKDAKSEAVETPLKATPKKK